MIKAKIAKSKIKIPGYKRNSRQIKSFIFCNNRGTYLVEMILLLKLSSSEIVAR